MSLGEELLAEADEPPDEQQRTPRPTPARPAPLDTAAFSKTRPGSCPRQESLLTQALHSESDSQSEDEHHTELRRGLSTASTWSNVSIASTDLTSDGGFTSPGTRTSSPSPPLPPTIHGLPSIFINKKDSELTIRHDDASTEKVEKKTSQTPAGDAVEAGLGRRRCITFACGKKENTSNVSTAKPKSPPKVEVKPTEPALRRCTIKFACDAKATALLKKPRMASPPPPPNRLTVPSKGMPRSHRGSDSTVRNDSPKSVRKNASNVRHSRKYSENSDIGRCEATRFHEFASSEEEVDEWTQEQTCHKTRLTVTDTLRIENGLRKLGEEVEEEALEDDEEDEEDLDEDDEDLDDLDDELEDDEEEEADDEEDDEEPAGSDGSVSDGGFQTDDEGGFAVSDDESDAGSDYEWWAPGRTAAASSSEQPEHIRPTAGHRSLSDSSNCSVGSVSGAAMFSKTSPAKKRKPVNIRPCSPELPDSTDFVCGTLDEDRPLEEAYYSALEQRRAAKHKMTPQDIDPTFPTSDPEMDEEDEDDEVDQAAEDSDQHMLMHGQLDHIDEVEGRGRRRTGAKRSPAPSPKRLRSPPPPLKRGQAHRSPPPRRLFGQSPKRLRSPPPAIRLRSPPPTRRTSLAVTSRQQEPTIQFAGMDQGPPPMVVASLPRPPTLFHQVSYYDDDEEGDSTNDTLKRGPMDIKAGTALKRQRRKEKLYQKHCRKACKKEERRPAPGKGAERMREVGMGLAAYRGKKATPVHVLSY